VLNRHLRTTSAGVIATLLLALPLPAAAQGTLSALQTDVDQIARRARPSVVTVMALRAEKVAKTTTAAPAKGDAARPSARVRTRVGSGVAVEDQLIVTTASVVLHADRVLVSTANSLRADAEIVGVDPVFNLALLRVPGLRVPPLRLAEGRDARVGDWIVSLGTTYNAQPSQSLGNIAQRHEEPGLPLLQLTNTVYPGNSGAAALNIRGELAGLVIGELGFPILPGADQDVARRQGSTSFAVPVETLRRVVDSFKREGRVRHGYFGATTLAASVQSDRDGGPVTPIGAQVEGIIGGGPAQRLGLRPGDLVVAYNGMRVETPEQLARWVLATPPGQTVKVVWVRSETGYDGTVALGESPEIMPQWLIGSPDDDAVPDSPRKVAELEREIRRLSQELDRLKDQSGSP
jgi:serine protease Do